MQFLTLKNVVLNNKIISCDTIIEMQESEITAKLVARKTLKPLSAQVETSEPTPTDVENI